MPIHHTLISMVNKTLITGFRRVRTSITFCLEFLGSQFVTKFMLPPGRQESCGSSMPHGFELECAGVVGGVATLCNGSVILRIEETDDRQKLVKRLG